MTKRTAAASKPAAELAAKLEAITDAAPGLWRAGVTSVEIDGVKFGLGPIPPGPDDRSDEDKAADGDPLSLAAYRRGMVKP